MIDWSTINLNVYTNGTILCLDVNSNELQPITVYNTGGVAVTNTALAVVIPAGLAYSSHTASVGTYDSGTSIWTIPILGVGASATLNICFEVTDASEGPWEVTYSAVHDTNPDSIPTDQTAAKTFYGFNCDQFASCWQYLQEFDDMASAEAALGPGRMFLASLANTEGWSYRAVLVTPFP